ncbi:hypothetical protein EVAR_95973_1 [Eumeta japonica]|uniref:Uncharacterized protein n=1 Tax=Eumeta variegata TaxID=151549 RepID=A0A4C1V7L4_EUMVA|nr:hypothetical protein EVAR_95973_1 [Eumeta japonica]
MNCRAHGSWQLLRVATARRCSHTRQNATSGMDGHLWRYKTSRARFDTRKTRKLGKNIRIFEMKFLNAVCGARSGGGRRRRAVTQSRRRNDFDVPASSSSMGPCRLNEVVSDVNRNYLGRILISLLIPRGVPDEQRPSAAVANRPVSHGRCKTLEQKTTAPRALRESDRCECADSRRTAIN